MTAAAQAVGSALTVRDLWVEAVDTTGATIQIVRGVSFDLRQGEVLGLLGESGAGKTMICRAITQALPSGVRVRRGTIETGGTRPSAVFADPHASLDPLQKVGAQIVEVAQVSRGLNRRAAEAETLELLDSLKLRDPKRVFAQYPFQLSGGMAQRAMIAAALASQPKFIIADEPTSALDATVQLDVLDLLRSLAVERHVGILLTTHDIAAASRVCTTLAIAYAGKLCEIGPTRQLLETPRHPYTKLLLATRPRGARGQRLATIRGEPLAPGDPHPPCAFAPRCPSATALCHTTEPLLVQHGDRSYACHFPHAVIE